MSRTLASQSSSFARGELAHDAVRQPLKLEEQNEGPGGQFSRDGRRHAAGDESSRRRDDMQSRPELDGIAPQQARQLQEANEGGVKILTRPTHSLDTKEMQGKSQRTDPKGNETNSGGRAPRSNTGRGSNNPAAPRSASKGSKQGVRELQGRQMSRLDSDVHSTGSSRGPPSGTGKLFDPRRDDPIKFQNKGRILSGTAGDSQSSLSMTSRSDRRSVASSAMPTTPTASTTSSNGRDRRKRRGQGSRTTEGSQDGRGAKAEIQSKIETSSYVLELKKRYRDITQLERELQHASDAVAPSQRGPHSTPMSDGVSSSSSVAQSCSSWRNGSTSNDAVDFAEWTQQIGRHRRLAEAHVLFMEAAFRPGLPASLSSLPRSYNIPTRLWQNAFHSLIDKLSHILPDWEAVDGAEHMNPNVSTDKEARKNSSVLELLSDFVYFAYPFYTYLLENEQFKTFRPHWVENLGDLARYRSMIVKRSAKIAVDSPIKTASVLQDDPQTIDLKSTNLERLESHAIDGREATAAAASHHFEHDRASVSSAALREWDLDEAENWRNTAEQWYAQALAEAPANGRLHFHLGALNRSDELKGLYYSCKSMITSHPYPCAREAILPFFDRVSQSRRAGPDASIADLFVYLHGTLLTKVQLDDFGAAFDRYKEKLQATLLNSQPLSQTSWMMMAMTNIAALLKYATKDESLNKQHKRRFDKAPPAKPTEGSSSGGGDGSDSDEGSCSDSDGENIIRKNGGFAPSESEVDIGSEEQTLPCAERCALQLAFETLDISLLNLSQLPSSTCASYVTTMMTFLAHEARQQETLRRFESFIPWKSISRLGNSTFLQNAAFWPPNDTVAFRIRNESGPLPEDWCSRGTAWVGRQVYERGFWKQAHGFEPSSRIQLEGTLSPCESEVDVFKQYGSLTPAVSEHTASDHEAIYGVGQSPSEPHTAPFNLEALALARWKRIAHTLSALANFVPGLDRESDESGRVRYVLVSPLTEKMRTWHMIQKQEHVLRELQTIQISAQSNREQPQGERNLQAVPDANADMPDQKESFAEDREDVRLLKERRQGLQRQLQEMSAAQMMMRHGFGGTGAVYGHDGKSTGVALGSSKVSKGPEHVHVMPGYTVLVMDTNVIVAPTHAFVRLVESSQWTIVVPLSVVTELDGLARRAGDVGDRAKRALHYMEVNNKTKSVNLKVQTSRGNYLADLRLRSEKIDFDGREGGDGSAASTGDANDSPEAAAEVPARHTQGVAKVPGRLISAGIDDHYHDSDAGQPASKVKASSARSVDDVILRCLSWQAGNYWRDRLLMLCPDDSERAAREAHIMSAASVGNDVTHTSGGDIDSRNKSKSKGSRTGRDNESELRPTARAVLVTLDRNLRLKARAQGLQSIGPDGVLEAGREWASVQ